MIRFRRKRVSFFFLLMILVVLYNISLLTTQEQKEEAAVVIVRDQIIYQEPTLKILVLAYNRSASLAQCLNSLQELKLDGSNGTVEIWIDRAQNGTVHKDVLKTAQHFQWKHGTTRIHIQEKHVGIYGQWINTWTPDEKRPEIAILLEDDIDLSPYAFRWLREAHHQYNRKDNIAGYGLSDIEIPLNLHNEFLQTSSDEVVFLFQRFSTFGFSPKASVWKQFQIWYDEKVQNSSFKPYTKSDSLFTKWFKIFEKRKSSSSMWSMWFIRFCAEKKLYTLYANTFQYLNKLYPKINNCTNLAYHRREVGLHFFGNSTRKSQDYLLRTWYPELVNFPSEPATYTIPPPRPRKRARVVKRVVSKKNIQKKS